MPKFKNTNKVKNISMLDRINLAIKICWSNHNKPMTRNDLEAAYKAHPAFKGRKPSSVNTSAKFDWGSLRQTDFFNVVTVAGKGTWLRKALVLKPQYAKQAQSPTVDKVPNLPTPTGRPRGKQSIIPNVRLVDVAKRMNCSYSSVYSAVRGLKFTSKATRRRILKTIKSMGGDISKLGPAFHWNRTTVANQQDAQIKYTVISEKNVRPGDEARMVGGKLIFLRAAGR